VNRQRCQRSERPGSAGNRSRKTRSRRRGHDVERAADVRINAAAERPTDHAAQFEFAQAAFAAGERDAAAATLLKLVETDPEWNEGAARAKLLQIFEAVGLEDPWVQAQRRKLSLLLFG
jgi:putative thioredoxin